MAINQVEYSNSPAGPVIHIFGRDGSGIASQIQVTGFRPYFYAPVKEADSLKKLPAQVAEVETGSVYRSIRGEELRRIYTFRPGDVRDVRSQFRHFEADIPFATRFMIDMGLTGGAVVPDIFCDYSDVKPAEVQAPARICMMDIECEDERGFPDAGRDKINCIACWDSFDDEYTTFFWQDASAEAVILPVSEKHLVHTYTSESSLLNGLVR